MATAIHTDRAFCSASTARLERSESVTALVRHVIAAFGPPTLAATLGWHLAPWQFMCVTVFTVYFGLKLLTFSVDFGTLSKTPWRAAGYLLLWPGMDSRRFCRAREGLVPRLRQCFAPALLVLAGGCLIPVGVQVASAGHPWLGGWLIVAGLLLVMHFGVFEILAILWRRRGINARPLMNRPWAATSLADFWGSRWNTAFRDLTFRFVARPVGHTYGARAGLLAAFTVSGLVHEVGISLPAGAGWGLPTLFFAIQAAGMSFERMPLARKLGLTDGWAGRVWTAGIVLLPAPVLFHLPFLERVILPLGAVLCGG